MLPHPPVPPTSHKMAVYLDIQTTGRLNHGYYQAAVSRIQGVEDPENFTQVRALGHVPTVASMDVAACEDIPFLVRRVVREELVWLQAGDAHHQCSFAACPEPPSYWMRERHVENRPRTESADFTPRFSFSRRVTATTECHHLDVPLQTSYHCQPGLYQKTTMRHLEMLLQSPTCLRVLLPLLLLLM
ncbi:hypothetical protein HPB51_020435 [Rhipicephalus microplus]|uniref:Uncharacterized protein n=1 Tax=Rhipicephalus microplus TaxID=6941 RepID=A0A9J6DCR7_RHIMP|nr:hypothetical protein HPB51_020435 [Rhipicephalus microplus]